MVLVWYCSLLLFVVVCLVLLSFLLGVFGYVLLMFVVWLLLMIDKCVCVSLFVFFVWGGLVVCPVMLCVFAAAKHVLFVFVWFCVIVCVGLWRLFGFVVCFCWVCLCL